MHRFLHITVCGALLFCGFGATCARAETGADAWLRYAPLEKLAAGMYSDLPVTVVVLGDSPMLNSAKTELLRGVHGMLGRSLREVRSLPQERAIVIGTLSALRGGSPSFLESVELKDDGFLLSTEKFHGVDCLIVAATTERGVLYGVFALLSKIAREENVSALTKRSSLLPRFVGWINGTTSTGESSAGTRGRLFFLRMAMCGPI